MPDKYRCSKEELSPGEIMGLSFTAQSGLISAAAVVGLLGVITIRYVKRIRNETNRSWKLVRTNIDGLMLNLLVADLFMSFGAILDVKWASLGNIYNGGHCNAQGAIQLVGETSVALFTLAITVLSFISIRVRPVKCRLAVWGGISGVVWLFVILWAIVGYKGAGSTLTTSSRGYWGNIFGTQTTYLHGFTAKRANNQSATRIWIAAFGSIFLYIPLFFTLRGGITQDAELASDSLRRNRCVPELEPERDDGISVASSQSGVNPSALLWYPLAYTLCVLPMSVVRWITFGHIDCPTLGEATATFVAVFIFNLSGLANVVLILWTRAGVLLLNSEPDGDGEEAPQPRQEMRSVSSLAIPEAGPPRETGFGGPCLASMDRSPDFDTGRVNREGQHQQGLGDGSPGSDSGAYK